MTKAGFSQIALARWREARVWNKARESWRGHPNGVHSRVMRQESEDGLQAVAWQSQVAATFEAVPAFDDAKGLFNPETSLKSLYVAGVGLQIGPALRADV